MSEPLFQAGDNVKHLGSGELGVITGSADRHGGEYWYRVRFANKVERVPEEDLEPLSDEPLTPLDLATQGAWGRLATFRSALAAERIRSTNRSTVYTFRSQRILFEPYQYKPLLKLLDSYDRRLLIADEVGLGKTIEAGLILAEMEARATLERVLVVCPSRLRDKWREELNRKFDQDFEILDGRAFRAYAEKIQSNTRQTRFRAIASLNSLRSEALREILRDEIGQVDLVIFDEAHHCRNPSTSTSQLLRDICEISSAVILLSATPIQLHSRDLFTLLNALRPDEFRDPNVFDSDLKRFAAVHEATRLARAADDARLQDVVARLEACFVENVPAGEQDPVARQVIEDLQENPPVSLRQRIEMERRITDLHPLSSLLSRTRKRDVIDKAPVRRARIVTCDWTAEEERQYENFVGGGARRGWFRKPAGFAQVQRARQAASCLPAAIGFVASSSANDDDSAIELADILPSDAVSSGDVGDSEAATLRAVAPAQDSKYDIFEKLLQQIWQDEPDAKVLVFTFFRGTACYLQKRLAAAGVNSEQISGEVVSDPKNPERDARGKAVTSFRENPDVRVLVSTEVGSEGLDFQFCHHVVNYDLPWNPMVVEQRIGRIDRYGQKSAVVHVWNIVVRDSVEEKILERLYRRIGIFEQSIGELEEILGDTVSSLLKDYALGALSPEESERRVTEATRAIENRRSQLESLEKQAGQLFGHEEFIREEMNRVGRQGRFMSQEALLALIQVFLEKHHPAARLWSDREQTGCWNLKVTDSLRHAIEKAAQRQQTVWVSRSNSEKVQLTFSGELAFENPHLELVNVAHPLTRAAVDGLGDLAEDPASQTGQASLRLTEEDPEISPGLYYLLVYMLGISGVRDRRLFEVVAWSDADASIMDVDISERLLHLVMTRGEEWHDERAAAPLDGEVVAKIEEHAIERTAAIRSAEQRENEALYLRRFQSLRAEYERHQEIKERRLETAKRNKKTRVIPALEGQLQKLRTDHAAKIDRLDKARRLTVSLSSNPVALCAVRVSQ